ncbi:uncharacterized protein C15orf65 homolog isoform X2 [Mauremys reevesii]|uniref:uncharacterized protein C15orf65 homolog isoform X2 n=1 Tax=Mauremys reevesii TaxID=260615 RepID=UPI00193FA964|nr:uncharacterized protein C15orf65 homolog isoform X2 [Mauremys reevesii]
MRKSNLFNCLPVQILAILCFPASQYFIQRKQMTILETVKETLPRHKRQFDAQLPLKDFQWELSAYHPVIENLSKKNQKIPTLRKMKEKEKNKHKRDEKYNCPLYITQLFRF